MNLKKYEDVIVICHDKQNGHDVAFIGTWTGEEFIFLEPNGHYLRINKELYEPFKIQRFTSEPIT